MNIQFKKIHLHHFLSFGDSEVNLTNKGYCLVKGINKNPKDAAKSNGSGKSTIFNAISFALTGETLQGIKSNLGNHYFEDGCYVELEFVVDGASYKLIRSKNDAKYGTNLKIFVNNEDKSGKGIRESEAVLEQYLPDLTSELLGGVIILGQGLPQKFTANTPVGRKEVLEHLSKSDFMIKDVKDRIERRAIDLNNKNREYEDKLLSISSKRTVYNNQLENFNNKLIKLKETSLEEFDNKINSINSELEVIKRTLNDYDNEKVSLNKQKDELNEITLKAVQNKSRRLETLNKEYNEYDKEYSGKKLELNLKIKQLEKEIQDIKNIKDVCPTCGRPFEGVVKPSTKAQEEEVTTLKVDLELVEADIKDNNTQYKEMLDEINKMFNDESSEAQGKLNGINNRLAVINEDVRTLSNLNITKNSELNNLINDKNNYTNNLKEANDNIANINTSLNELNTEEQTILEGKNKNQTHIDVVNKFKTLVQRDFRGVLLKNVIDYINERAKNYCSKIFNTDELEFKLDGTSIDITFCNKEYENLSGGEKQRVDLITQFAIRDMMCKYLDFSSNILVLDEITDALDSVSCDRVINFITNELKDIESIFIISHHSDELEIPYDCEIVVSKNDLGISEVM